MIAAHQHVCATVDGRFKELVIVRIARRANGLQNFDDFDDGGDALEQRFPSLAAEPERWPAMGRAGRAKVEREYDIDRLNDRFAGLLENLIRPEARPR